MSGLTGLSGAGAKSGDVDDHELLDLGDDDDDGPNWSYSGMSIYNTIITTIFQKIIYNIDSANII